MKIAIFSDNFYPELSGIADSIITLATQLASMGHHIMFYVPQYSAANYQKTGLKAHELNLGDNIGIHRFFSFSVPAPTGQARMVIPSPFIPSHIKKFKPDVVHSQLFFGVGLNALIAAKELKVPMVGTNHTAISEFMPPNLEWLRSGSIKYAVWYYNRCRFVTAPSQSVFTEMERHGFHRPHKVVSNPIDTVTFSPASIEERAALKKKFGLSSHAVFYAGRLAPEKDIDVVVKALALVRKEVPDVVLALAGHGSSEDSLKKLVADLKLEDHVRFLGTLSKPDLAQWYRASDLFTIMSTSETQSLTLMQAMASALPVIGARARALPEYINDNNGFLVEPGDHKMLAEKMTLVLKDPDLAAKLSRGGHEFVQRFSPSAIAREWLSIYQNVARPK